VVAAAQPSATIQNEEWTSDQGPISFAGHASQAESQTITADFKTRFPKWKAGLEGERDSCPALKARHHCCCQQPERHSQGFSALKLYLR